MMVLRPAVILGSERGTLLVVSCGQGCWSLRFLASPRSSQLSNLDA